MGLIQNGQWVDQWYDTDETKGHFKRQESRFRNRLVAPSQANAETEFVAESGRYHLFVALACPWAHRTLIFRKLKQLEDHITVSVVEPLMLENGWEFGEGGDPLTDKKYLYQVYLQAAPDYEGRVTVPVLWDKKTGQIVNNESAEIIRQLNTAFNEITGDTQDFYPENLRGDIDHWNERIYNHVNNGVYKAGFATEQTAYEEAYDALFNELEALEAHLSVNEWLVGASLTEADWRLFTTLVRFDAVYHGHFKCNLRKISEYPALFRYVKRLYQIPGIAETVNMSAIKQHYYGSHKTINPTGVVPKGPDQNFTG